jgi:hypothetical protein
LSRVGKITPSPQFLLRWISHWLVCYFFSSFFFNSK